MKHPSFLIVGAGFSGAVLARQLVERLACDVTILDRRSHLAGNCHTARDSETGIMMHEYGPHIFNTSHEDVWCWVKQFGTMMPFTNRVKANISKGVFSLPINLHTINQFFATRFSPNEAKEFIAARVDTSIVEPKNFEEQALSMIGRDLYEAFFYGYTKKQWGCEPKELPASILKRLPVRFSYDDNYYNSIYQGIPLDGYTTIVANILDHVRINVSLETDYNRRCIEHQTAHHVFYTGALDEYFDYEFGPLSNRTVTFKLFRGGGDYQGNAVINYPEMAHPYTRIHEHKHFAPWERHVKTVWFEEYSKDTGLSDVPFYPKRLPRDMEKLAAYQALARQQKKSSFLGRLASYRYINMDQAIGEALDFSNAVIDAINRQDCIPRFSVPRAMRGHITSPAAAERLIVTK
jgi:UDP-galactopyranose mutase